jgi:hypothetical protein
MTKCSRLTGGGWQIECEQEDAIRQGFAAEWAKSGCGGAQAALD